MGQVLPPAPQMVEKQGWTYVSRPNQVGNVGIRLKKCEESAGEVLKWCGGMVGGKLDGYVVVAKAV